MRQFKFIGTKEQASNYIKPITVGETYLDDYFLDECGGSEISEQTDLDEHWEEVTNEELAKEWQVVTKELVDKPKRQFKYVGTKEQADEYRDNNPTVGKIYSEDDCSFSERSVLFWATPEDSDDEISREWEEVVSAKKYKLINDHGWESFKLGNIYDGSYVPKGSDYSVEWIANCDELKKDWEEVTYEIANKLGLNLEEAVEGIRKFGQSYASVGASMNTIIFEKVTDKIFTDAEVVTLVTFLNDNFEDFRFFIEKYGSDGLAWEFYKDLNYTTYGGKAPSLIDKLEQNDTVLTEAEKVTIITFLNDNFEEFDNFVELPASIGGLEGYYYWKLSDVEDLKRASNLIDKIENL